MFKKTMTFDDLEGNEVTQTFYFNYNKKELAELMEFGDLENKIKKLQVPVEESGMSQLENTQQAYNIFQELILGAYGEKGADNVTFVKNDRTREYFENHVAFVELIFEMIQSPKLAAQFIEQCVPAKLLAAAKAEQDKPDISALVEEAARRQKDPATRIEPGLAALPETTMSTNALPETVQQEVPKLSYQKPPEELTEKDILEMPEDEFAKLDVRKLGRNQMLAAYRRRSTES